MADNRAIRIVPLADHLDLLDSAAAMMHHVWPGYYGPDGPGDALAHMRERCRATGLPYGVLALTADNDIVGSGTLAGRSYGAEVGEDLWIISLFVRPDQRGCGIASDIVRGLEQHATENGHQKIHATTNTAVNLLSRLNWMPLRCFEDDTGLWRVMRKMV